MKIPEATHWAFALRENGNLEIMSLPDLKVRYKIQNLNLAPNVLSDALNTASIPTTQGNLLKGIAQQCFAFTPQANFPAHNLNFH